MTAGSSQKMRRESHFRANPGCGLSPGQNSKTTSPAPAKVTANGILGFVLLLTQLGLYALSLVLRPLVKTSPVKCIGTELGTGFFTRSELVGLGYFIGSA